MKGDLPIPAFRLMQQLPVHTHRAPEPDRYDGRVRHCKHNVRPVIVDGTLYESLTEAARQLGRCREAIRKRIYKGTARYA